MSEIFFSSDEAQFTHGFGMTTPQERAVNMVDMEIDGGYNFHPLQGQLEKYGFQYICKEDSLKFHPGISAYITELSTCIFSLMDSISERIVTKEGVEKNRDETFIYEEKGIKETYRKRLLSKARCVSERYRIASSLARLAENFNNDPLEEWAELMEIAQSDDINIITMLLRRLDGKYIDISLNQSEEVSDVFYEKYINLIGSKDIFIHIRDTVFLFIIMLEREKTSKS